MKPGDYKVEVMVKATVNVRDITQPEIDEHGDNVIMWAINEDFDWSTFKVTEILNVQEV